MNIKEAIDQYVAYRQNLGEKYQTQGHYLTTFCRYIGGDRNLKSLSTSDVEGFLCRHRISFGTWVGYSSALKGLFEWAFCRKLIETIPIPDGKPQKSSTLIPYIYTRDELKRLFDAALKLPDTTKRKAIPYVFKVLFTLMYATGMRSCEILGLTIGDVDMVESVIRIKGSKFYKTRLVPFNNQIQEFLGGYLKWRDSEGFSSDSSAPLFMTSKGERIRQGMLHSKFAKMRSLAGIERNDSNRYHPRIHDLRHTFATHRLEQWYKEGVDLSAMLPVLSVYLGHTSIGHTSVYLSITSEILRHASALYENYTNNQ